MTNKIIPAILESSKKSIESKIKMVDGLTDEIQIDICDGRFVPSKTYASAGCTESVKTITRMANEHACAVEIDLMVDLDYANRLDRWINALVAARPRRVIFHLGSTYRWDELFHKLESQAKGTDLPFECGLAVRVDHTRREIGKIYDEHPFTYIQMMGIERIGYSGEKISRKIYDRIKKLRRKYADIDIAVDGGVKLENAENLFKAGANKLGVNSGLFGSSDIKEVFIKWRERI